MSRPEETWTAVYLHRLAPLVVFEAYRYGFSDPGVLTYRQMTGHFSKGDSNGEFGTVN